MNTSSRSNTRTHKGHTRKNGGVKHSFVKTRKKRKGKSRKPKVTIEWSRWFYKNLDAGCWKIPVKFIQERANKILVETLRGGHSLEDIKETYINKMEKQYQFVLQYKLLFKDLGIYGSYDEYLQEYSGDFKKFKLEWALDIAILMKLKVVEIDNENGPVGYMGDEEGNAKSLPRTIY